MEQYDRLFEYEMHGVKFDFEAPNEAVAQEYRELALIHFKDKLGADFRELDLRGPERVKSKRQGFDAA